MMLRRMGDVSKLKLGMCFDEVCRALEGWRHQSAGAIISFDKLHLFHSWDFAPPDGRGEQPLRITFDNSKLVIWGRAAPVAGNQGAAESAG